MEKKKISLLTAIVLFVVTVIYTVLVFFVDKAPIGPEGTEVGFAVMNGTFRDAIGLNPLWDKITDVMMALSFAAALSFVVMGVVQLVRKKSILKVDKEILALAVVYVLVVVMYVFFDKVPLNYRPFILEGESGPEASFPSTHTLVICTVLATAIVAWNRILENKKLANILCIAAIAVIVVGTAGRVVAGVHWLTDIIAGVLFSATITAAYVAVLDRLKQ